MTYEPHGTALALVVRVGLWVGCNYNVYTMYLQHWGVFTVYSQCKYNVNTAYSQCEYNDIVGGNIERVGVDCCLNGDGENKNKNNGGGQ